MWQDFAIAGSQILFLIALIIGISNKQKPPTWMSLLTFVGMVVIGMSFMTMGCIYSGIVSMITALLWLILFIQAALDNYRSYG